MRPANVLRLRSTRWRRRAKVLETTNREVAKRLDAAIDTIRTVLAANEP